MTAAFTLNNQLRFQGNAFYGMIGIMTGGILNIVLDPVFIFVFDFGVAGAAMATTLSQLISLIILIVFTNKKGIPLRFANIKRLINSGFYDLATAYQSVHVNY